MKKLFLLPVLALFCSLSVYAQKYHVDSTRFITGDKPATAIYHAIPTADKGILFAGTQVKSPRGIVPYFPLDTIFQNVMIGKIDSEQKISWIKVYGGTKDEGASSICQTPDGGYAVLGATTSADGDVTGYKDNGDIWLLRIGANGNLLWQKTYGSSQADGAISIANTPDGGFIILGVTNGSDGDVPFHYGGSLSLDWLVIKTDASGTVQWSKDLGGTGEEHTSGSILSVGSSYYLASGGISRDYDVTDNTWRASVGTLEDFNLLKLDNTGNVLWTKTYGGSRRDVANNAIYDERDNTIVMTGESRSSDYMCTNQHGGEDMLTIKTDMDGNVIWSKCLGRKSDDYGKCIIKDNGTGYLVYGMLFPNPDTTFGSIGGQDNMLISIDKDGNELAYKIFGGKDAESPAAIVPYLGTYVATGSSWSNIFTEGTCNVNMSSAFVSYLGAGALSVNNIRVTDNRALGIYPNPSHTSVTISVPHSSGRGRLTIMGSNGQVVWQQRMRPADADVNIDQWAAGLYMVRWEAHDGASTTSLVKN